MPKHLILVEGRPILEHFMIALRDGGLIEAQRLLRGKVISFESEDNGGKKMSTAQRRFLGEVSTLIDKTVTVTTLHNKTYTGTLIGMNPENLSLCLADARDEKGQPIHKVVLSGNVIAQVLATEKGFDLRGLAERLEKVFPRMVRLYEKEGFIWVMDKIKVTENGIVEGSGPAAERVERVYSQFISEIEQA